MASGLGSIPGTAAEVLSEPVRTRLCPEKLSARQWCAVVLQAHRSGLPSTGTLMAGHLESSADRAAHLLTLVALQQAAWQHQQAGFSEFVLLPFIGAQAPAALRQRVGRDQPDHGAMLALTAQARLLLGPWLANHQPSWAPVPCTPEMAMLAMAVRLSVLTEPLADTPVRLVVMPMLVLTPFTKPVALTPVSVVDAGTDTTSSAKPSSPSGVEANGEKPNIYLLLCSITFY